MATFAAGLARDGADMAVSDPGDEEEPVVARLHCPAGGEDRGADFAVVYAVAEQGVDRSGREPRVRSEGGAQALGRGPCRWQRVFRQVAVLVGADEDRGSGGRRGGGRRCCGRGGGSLERRRESCAGESDGESEADEHAGTSAA